MFGTNSMLLPTLILLLAGSEVLAISREVSALSIWARQKGVEMHENLEWVKYEHAENDWGLELKAPVPPGTSLLKVPKDLALRSDVLQNEFASQDGDKLKAALKKLGDYAIHQEVFFIVMKLYRCRKDGDASQWCTWVEAMPKTYPVFNDAEKACLPAYAKHAADYQAAKFKAFCDAAEALEGAPVDIDALTWAFGAVSSRCWKPVVSETDSTRATSMTELVPVGDMFNHREPPNVALTHDDDGSVNFIYKGNVGNSKDERGLYLTYGSSWNPHRFLVMFGFCDTSMPHVWSQLVLPPNNPHGDDPANMVFGTADGSIPIVMWDAILYELLRSTKAGQVTTDNMYSQEELREKYKFATTTVLRGQVNHNLEELEELRQKIDAIRVGNNIGLIRQHNEFLTSVYSRALSQLDEDDSK